MARCRPEPVSEPIGIDVPRRLGADVFANPDLAGTRAESSREESASSCWSATGDSASITARCVATAVAGSVHVGTAEPAIPVRTNRCVPL